MIKFNIPGHPIGWPTGATEYAERIKRALADLEKAWAGIDLESLGFGSKDIALGLVLNVGPETKTGTASAAVTIGLVDAGVIANVNQIKEVRVVLDEYAPRGVNVTLCEWGDGV